MFIKYNSRRLLTLTSKTFTQTMTKRTFNALRSDTFVNGRVLWLNSNDIFTCLSAEEWIYRNIDLTNKTILLFWTNGPSVVVGRHQNPWRECHVGQCLAEDVSVVRRNSGGGTVYHDLNNLNISFLSDKRLYNRLNNLKVIKNVLFNKFHIDCDINERQDLVLQKTGHKISGTASKLGAHNSYHHLTLLVDVDMNRMRQLIRRQSTFIRSKATDSVRSVTTNLKAVNNKIRMQDVVNEIAVQFIKEKVNPSAGYREVMVEENTFTGIEDIKNTFRSWKWIYGKTPRFTVNKDFFWEEEDFGLQIEVFHGLIESLDLTKFKTNIDLKGIKFTKECISHKLNEILSQTKDNYCFEKFLCKCVINCFDETIE